jgi:ribose/xylose/arabinose/galactoside ABC-type transport system permease subunit
LPAAPAISRTIGRRLLPLRRPARAFLLVFRALQLSHIGWAFRALRDDEVAAELAGVDVSRYRIYAATIGSAMIGLTGALFAYSSSFISPATYSFDRVDVLRVDGGFFRLYQLQ